MFSEKQAKILVEATEPGAKSQACVSYRGLYIIRVVHPDPDEANYDPFYSVNQQTGEVKEFSVMHDGDIVELTALFEAAS